MRRFVQYFNFVGILALAALCAVQWQANRQVNLKAIELEKTRLEQIAKIEEQEKTIQGQKADLDDLRQRLELSEAAFKEVEGKLNAMTVERDALLNERDQLKASMEKWKAAVEARDDEIKQASDQLQKLADERNQGVAKFNDLAGKYNALVKDLDEARAKK